MYQYSTEESKEVHENLPSECHVAWPKFESDVSRTPGDQSVTTAQTELVKELL